jgi:hypothetical protein
VLFREFLIGYAALCLSANQRFNESINKKNMKAISWILIGIGFFITALSNLATFYGLRAAVNGMENSAENGIGIVAWGMSFSYTSSFIGLFGCFILFTGMIFAVLGALIKKRV